MQRDSLAMRKKLLGSDHPDVADSLGELASILQAQGKLADAETFAREALAIRKTKLGNEHEDVAGSHDILAEVLKEEGKFADAEPELLEANRIWQKREDAGPKMKRNSIEKLSKFYSAWVAATPDSDRIAKAREWKAKLVEFDAASAQNGSPTVEK